MYTELCIHVYLIMYTYIPNYVYMQENYVYMQDNYVYMYTYLCIHAS